MKQQVFRTDPTRPWSPLSVSLITFLLPAGGAVLTVHNLARLRETDSAGVRRESIAVVLLYAFGFALILTTAPIQADGIPQLDSGTYSVIQFGLAIAAYIAQRVPFRMWTEKHARQTSAWTSAVLTALIYQLLAIFITVPVYVGVISLVGSASAP